VFDAEHIAVANIASPGTAKNIEANPKVCLTFVHVFAQKGYKIKGQAINILALLTPTIRKPRSQTK